MPTTDKKAPIGYRPKSKLAKTILESNFAFKGDMIQWSGYNSKEELDVLEALCEPVFAPEEKPEWWVEQKEGSIYLVSNTIVLHLKSWTEKIYDKEGAQGRAQSICDRLNGKVEVTQAPSKDEIIEQWKVFTNRSTGRTQDAIDIVAWAIGRSAVSLAPSRKLSDEELEKFIEEIIKWTEGPRGYTERYILDKMGKRVRDFYEEK